MSGTCISTTTTINLNSCSSKVHSKVGVEIIYILFPCSIVIIIVIINVRITVFQSRKRAFDSWDTLQSAFHPFVVCDEVPASSGDARGRCLQYDLNELLEMTRGRHDDDLLSD